MIEYEKKILLSKVEYEVLLRKMGRNASTTVQTNYYYDTVDYAMNRKGVTCRIREENGKYTATIKRHGGGGMDCSIESTAEVQHTPETTAFQEMGLSYQGSLQTERTVAFSDVHCELVLDRNIYLGKTDYELELEYLPPSEEYAIGLLRWVAEILMDAGCITTQEVFLSRIGQTEYKSKRFFSQKECVIKEKYI